MWKLKKLGKKKLLEALRLKVICSAKATMLMMGRTEISLVSNDDRFFDDSGCALWRWIEVFQKAGMDFEEELRKMVKEEFGTDFDVKKGHQNSYCGSGANTWYSLVSPIAPK